MPPTCVPCTAAPVIRLSSPVVLLVITPATIIPSVNTAGPLLQLLQLTLLVFPVLL